jgi:hypothetical protein
MQLTRGWVALRMRGVPAEERATEVRWPNGFQFVCQFVGPDPDLRDRERLTGVADDVGISREVDSTETRSAGPLFTEFVGHVGGSHPPVAVPVRSSVAQPKAVRHSGAHEPVIGGRVRVIDRVRPNA